MIGSVGTNGPIYVRRVMVLAPVFAEMVSGGVSALLGLQVQAGSAYSAEEILQVDVGFSFRDERALRTA